MYIPVISFDHISSPYFLASFFHLCCSVNLNEFTSKLVSIILHNRDVSFIYDDKNLLIYCNQQ